MAKKFPPTDWKKEAKYILRILNRIRKIQRIFNV